MEVWFKTSKSMRYILLLLCVCLNTNAVPFAFWKNYILPTPVPDVGWYKFNNNYTDSAAHGNNLTGSGSPTFTTGQDGIANHAIALSGSSQNAEVNPVVGLPSSDVTYSAWVYPTTSTGSRAIVCIGNTASAPRSDFYIELDGGTLGIFKFDAGVFSTSSESPPIATNVWTHIGMVFNATTGIATVYTNGVFSFSTTSLELTPGFPAVVNTISVGAFVDNSNARLNYYQGKIDDVRIYTRQITATEDANIYAAGAQ